MSLLKLPFLTGRKAEEFTIAGCPTKVYRASTKMLQHVRMVGKPAVRAFVALFADTSKDVGVEQTNSKTGENFSQMVKSSGAQPSIVQLRCEQKQAAVDQLLEGVLGENGSRLLVLLIADMLDQPEPATQKDVDDFLRALPLETLSELLRAFWKVNEETIAPLLKGWGLDATTLKQAVGSRLRAVPLDESAETSSTSSNDSAKT
jgi:hypothetical protein